MATISMENVLKNRLNNKLKSEITDVALSKNILTAGQLAGGSTEYDNFKANLTGDQKVLNISYKSVDGFEINNDLSNLPMLVFNVKSGGGNEPKEVWLLKKDTVNKYFIDGTITPPTPISQQAYDFVVHLRSLKIEIIGAS